MRQLDIHGPETAYLFQCRSDAALFAVSLHETAGNIPPSTAWYGGWRRQRAFALASSGQVPAADEAAKRIADAVRRTGYFIWRDGLR